MSARPHRHGILRTAFSLCVISAFSVSALQCSGGGSSRQDGFGGAFGGGGGQGNAGGGGGLAAGGGGGLAAGGTGGGLGVGGGLLDAQGGVMDVSIDAFFVDDPPAPACNGNMNNPTNPGGTPRCPNDKNLEGCPCDPNLAMPAACWPGFRRHRNKGACADGEAMCERVGENDFRWGPCENFSGIDPMTYEPLGTAGAAACGCFSGGFWNIANLSPCFIFTGGAGSTTVSNALNTVQDMAAPGGARCPDASMGEIDAMLSTLPTKPFSTNDVMADCPGQFKLCYTFKALSAPMSMRMPDTDCEMKQICTESQYSFDPTTVPPFPTVDFPVLPAWITDTPSERACAQAFVDNGGYAEMSVEGQSDECDMVDKVFQTINYCPTKCNDPANAMDAECINCSNGAGAPF